jgi:flagellar hook assembly protein FlgD
MLGRKVATVTDREYNAGRHTVKWNGQNNSGQKTASGLYLYKLITGQGEISRKMLLLK